MPRPGLARAAQAGALRKVIVSGGLIALIVAAAAGMGRWIISQRPEPEVRPEAAPGYTVEVVSVERRDYQERILGYGVVQSTQSVTLAAQVAGKVVEAPEGLRVGAHIEAGQLLTRIEEETYAAELARRRALLEQARADRRRLTEEQENLRQRIDVGREDLRLAEREVRRQEELLKSGATSQRSLETAQTQLQVSRRLLLEAENLQLQRKWELARVETTIQAHEAEVEMARLDLERCQIRAPWSGMVAERRVEPGQLTSLGTNLWRLIEVSRVEIPVQVPASQITSLAVGRRAEIELPAAGGPQWLGRVIRISPEVDPVNRTAVAYLEVENDPSTFPLLPGELIEAEIEGRLFPDVMVIPRRALIDGLAYVKVEDRAARRVPKALAAFGDDLLVESGLAPGELLILTNLEMLQEGTQVITSAELNERLRRAQAEVGTSPTGH